MKRYILPAILALSGLAGCNSVASKQVSYTDSHAVTGLQYSAPKALFSVELISAGSDIIVQISEPFFVGDPDATFTLKASAGTFADQKYDFIVDAETRLLSSIRSESLGQLDQVLVSAAGAAGGFRSLSAYSYGAAPVRQTLYHRIIDPMMQDDCGFARSCTFTTLIGELQAVAGAAMHCADTPEPGENRLCTPLRNGEDLFTIELKPLFAPVPDTAGSASQTCRGSVCYRAPVPYDLRLKVAGVTDVSQIVSLPNKAPLMAMNLPAGVFADAVSTVILVDGMPVQMTADKENELAAAAAVPLDMVDSFFTSASRVLALRVDFNNSQIAALESQTELEQAKEARADFRRTRGLPEPEVFTSNTRSLSEFAITAADPPEASAHRPAIVETTATPRPSLFSVTIPGG